MKNIFQVGDKKAYTKVISDLDVAAFSGNVVHNVYATFCVARDAEWATRQFVLEMKEDDEEGIGTFLSVEHKSPAFVGEKVVFSSSIEAMNENELICSYEAHVGDRLVARGKTGQKVFPVTKLKKLLTPT
jgi:predicted thioesterase